MSRRTIQTVVLAIAIPLAGLLAVAASEGQLESVWRSVLVGQLGPQPTEVLDRVRLTAICQRPEAATVLSDACGAIGQAELVKILALVAMGLSVVLLGGLVPLRRFATRDRRLLLWFRPALAIVLVALTVLVVLDGAVIGVAAYLTESVFTNAVHPYVIAAIGLAVLFAASGVLRATLTMGRSKPLRVSGIPLDRDHDARLFETVDELAARMGVGPPDQIVAGFDPTFFVTESAISVDGSTEQGRTLYLSIPFIRVLSRAELVAIIGHELGHFRGEDTTYSRRFYPVYRGATESFAVLRESARGWTGIPLLPPLRILELFFIAFVEAERRLSRERELAADQAGAEVSSDLDVAAALAKLEAYSESYGDAMTQVQMAVREARPPDNLSARFAQLAAFAPRPSTIADVDHGRIRHPIDGHPLTSERIAALGSDPAAVLERAASLHPVSPAIDLIERPEDLESDLMEDLVETIGGLAGRPGDGTATDRSDVIREAAETEPAIARLIAVLEPIRGHDLLPTIATSVAWVATADLELRAHETLTGWLIVTDNDLPSRNQLLVSNLATRATPDDLRVARGTRFRLAAISTPDRGRAGRPELMFFDGSRTVVGRLVGDWPLDEQVAGCFLVPETDPTARPTAEATEIGAIAAALTGGDNGPLPLADAVPTV